MVKPDGGPVFPIIVPAVVRDPYVLQNGMSLRDYFAGQALAAMADDIHYIRRQWNADEESLERMRQTARVIAETAGAIADAMLAEREK